MLTKITAILLTGLFLNFIPPHEKKEMIPPKDLIVAGPINEWQNLIECLNKSDERYPKVIAAQKFLLDQLNDTTLQKKLIEKLK